MPERVTQRTVRVGPGYARQGPVGRHTRADGRIPRQEVALVSVDDRPHIRGPDPWPGVKSSEQGMVLSYRERQLPGTPAGSLLSDSTITAWRARRRRWTGVRRPA